MPSPLRTFLFLLALLTVSQAGGQGAVAAAADGNRSPTAWVAGSEVDAKEVERDGLDQWFVQQAIPDDVFSRMKGKSFPVHCTIARSDLRYLRVLHFDGNGRAKRGEMVCNKAIAADLISIFKELYKQRYPIESIRLIDDFDADDERSMRANNSSAFCFRTVKGARKLSAHARGMAVDINTLYNPYYRKTSSGKVIIQPSNAGKYCNRSATFPYKIVKGDLLYRLFIQHGFRWGGAWRTTKDWQHFEK